MNNAAHSHGTVHVDVGDIVAPLTCDHSDGRYSIWIVADPVDVWLTGTLGELEQFAHQIIDHARRSWPVTS
jgi:hypothetical protein